ncbi:MAG TPA: YceI family protein, partial [Solirubrobacteraceae bacterium]|nr:YceI family protein [Solirubrobacteraceae bacterium]
MPPTATAITPGTYVYDPIHSSVTFSVRHFGAGRFRGGFAEFDASLTVDDDGSLALSGLVKVDSVQVKEPSLAGHLATPDFFDAERFPQIAFKSTSFEAADDGTLAVDGDLTLKGVTKNVHATGELTYVADDGHGNERIGVELSTTIDRTKFGVNFSGTLPGGEAVVANDVTLNVELELVKP